ncbi:hypothetical protein JHK82_033314 [Glycine max]|nr:hypothetical protein JHK82_033314 [Glycine max]KAG5139887.1 hypothetical protein JHK84_033655 [Glycine max]
MPMRAAKEKRSPTFLDRNPTPALSKLRTLSPTSTRMHQQQRLRHQVQGLDLGNDIFEEVEDEIVKVGDRFGGRNDFGNLRRRRCSIGGGGDSSLFFVHAPLAVSCFVSAPKPKRLVIISLNDVQIEVSYLHKT